MQRTCLVLSCDHIEIGYSVCNFACKMKNSYSWLYFGVATTFAVVAVVCSDEWSLDSRVDYEFNDLVKIFHSQRVGVLFYKQ